MNKITKKAIVIGIIAGILVLLDGIIVKLLNQETSFTWIAFVSWTVFFGVTIKERLKAILGYVLGFLVAIIIMQLGNLFSFMNVGIIAFGSILATIIMNYLTIELEKTEKIIPYSVSGIFVGIAMTFAGIGIGLTPNTIANSILMLGIIVGYGILGLLSGWATLTFGITQ